MPEFIDPVFTKTSPKRSFSVIQNERFGLVFAKTGSIISGTEVSTYTLDNLFAPLDGAHLIQPSRALSILVYSISLEPSTAKNFIFEKERQPALEGERQGEQNHMMARKPGTL